MASRMWKDGTRRAIVYVEGQEQAQRVLAAVGKSGAVEFGRLRTAEVALGSTMAVYSDKRGRPFAWQIPFDVARWDEISGLLQTS